MQPSISNPNEIILSTSVGIIFVNYAFNKHGQMFKFKYDEEEATPLFEDESIQGMLQYGDYLLIAIMGQTSLSLYNRKTQKVEKKIPVQTGSKEFFGIRKISEDLAIVRDTQFISVIDLKRQLCFPVFQTLLNESTGTHDYYLETQIQDENLTIHTLGIQKVPEKSSLIEMLRYNLSITALREFIKALG